MKKFNEFSKKRFDNGPMSMINKELKQAGHPTIPYPASPSMQPALSSSNPRRKAKL